MMENKSVSKRKIFFIAFSLVISAAIWLYVDLDKGTTVEIDVEDIPISYINEDVLTERGLMLLEDSDQTVDLTLEAIRTNIGQLDRSKIRIQADLSGIVSTGRQSITYRTYYPNKLDGNQFSTGDIVTKNVSAYMVSVNIGELSRKDIEVRCKLVGNVAEGYSAEEPVIQPGTLEVRGQEEDIAPVAYAQVVLEIDDATETVTRTLEYEFYDRDGNRLEGRGVYATEDQVQVTLPVNVTKELALRMNFIESPGASLDNVSWTISPATVTVSGDAAKLADVDSLVLDDFELVSLGSTTAYTYAIPIPEGCVNLSGVTRATLYVSFQDIRTATVTTNRFIYENVPSGKDIHILTEELPVTIFGTSADVEAVTGENILVVADLSNFDSVSGSYTVPAEVRIQTDGDIGVTGTYQVRINISEPQDDPPDQPQDEPQGEDSP